MISVGLEGVMLVMVGITHGMKLALLVVVGNARGVEQLVTLIESRVVAILVVGGVVQVVLHIGGLVFRFLLLYYTNPLS